MKKKLTRNFDEDGEREICVGIPEKTGRGVGESVVAHGDGEPLVEHVQTSKENGFRIKKVEKGRFLVDCRHFFRR